MKDVDSGDARKGGSLGRASQFGMRRSCDACGRKKRRCDGEDPCRRCASSNSECRYSKRRWHHSDGNRDQQQGLPQQRDRDVCASEYFDRSEPGALLERGILPFKRCRLRPSPATGLVGMRENAFLSDFFGCVGFLPLTNESQIRETMVKMMLSAKPRQTPACSTDCCGEEGQLRAPKGQGTFGDVSGTNHLPKDPSVCTYWCAVAMGALAKGIPFESVATYAQLARESLTASLSGSTDAELATASAILTYLHSFMGDMEKFREYVDLSESFVQATIKQGSPDLHTGLPDFIQHCRKVCNLQTGEVDSSWIQEQAPPQLDGFVTEDELYRYITQSFRAFDHAVFAEAQERCANTVEDFQFAGLRSQISSPNDPMPEEVSGAIAAVFGTSSSPDFEPLQEAADRPSIRAGIGGLFINGTLVFEKAAKGDLDATLERLDRSIEVFERYPGLCRCMMESHLSHMLLTMLAEIEDSRARGMYDRLRRAHNYCRSSQSIPIPPLDEWQGMAAICGDLHCRAIEDLIKSEHMKAFTKQSIDSTRDGAGLRQTFSSPHGQTKREISASGVAHRDVVSLVPASPDSSWTDCNATRECRQDLNLAGNLCLAGATSAPLVSPPYASSQSGTDFDSDCSNDVVPTRAVDSLSSSVGIGGYHEGIAEPESDEIAAADWLEVTYAMLDTVHAS